MPSKVFQLGSMAPEENRSFHTAHFSTALIDSNSVVVTIDTKSTVAEVYASSHLETLEAIIAKMLLKAEFALTSCEIVAGTTDLTIRWTSSVVQTSIAIVITGGISQPTMTYTNPVPVCGWGVADTEHEPGADDAIPYITLDNEYNPKTVEDESIVGKAFGTLPRIVGYEAANKMSFYARFYDMDFQTFWMWGFENLVRSCVIVESATGWEVGADPVKGDEFICDAKTYSFVRKLKAKDAAGKAIDHYLFYCAPEDVIDDPTGTLIHEGGADPDTELDFTAHSPIMYEHFFELDSIDRKLRDYTAAEIATLLDYNVGDKKNLMATIAKKMGSYDILYPNAMAKGWKYVCKPAAMTTWEVDLLAFEQQRGDFNSDDWTLKSSLADNANVPAHYQHTLEMGVNLAGLFEVCSTDVEVSCETAVQEVQTMCSGLHIAEPHLSGYYNMSLNVMIPRHSDQTYQTYRDGQTRLCAKLSANFGWYHTEMFIKRLALQKAGPNSDDIAAEPLEAKIGICPASENPFTDILLQSEVHESPLVYSVINLNPLNSMRLF